MGTGEEQETLGFPGTGGWLMDGQGGNQVS
jgi:hypothetical protein